MKICSKCKVHKKLSEFHRDRRTKSGYRSSCKTCAQQYRLDNIEKDKENKKNYYNKNSVRLKQYAKEHKANFYSTLGRENHLKNTYGIDNQTYNSMLFLQSNKCKICKVDASSLTKHLYVDHDHLTGKIRGLLCDRCNRGIGYFRDNVLFLKNAMEYLENAQ